MTNIPPTAPNETDDSAANYIELDLPTAPRARQSVVAPIAPITSAPVALIPNARSCNCPIGIAMRTNIGEVCSTCRGVRRRAERIGTAAVVAVDPAIEAAAKLATALAEIATLKREAARNRGFIAGANSVATGKFFGFGGQGSMRRDALLALLATAGVPTELAPGVKSAHAQAGDAVGRLNGRGYVVRTDKARATRDDSGREIPRTWKARWIVAQQVGAGFSTLGTVALTLDGKLDFSATFPTTLAAGIRSDFETLVAGAVYDATDISSWLRTMMASAFRGVAVGGNWFVRAKHAADAELLCATLAKTWGRNWLLPAVPMVASDELSTGIIESFKTDAAIVMDAFACERDAIGEDGKVIGISKRRAATLLSEVRELIERCAGFATMFGETKTADVKRKLVAIAEEIQASTDDISTRFGLIFDELARDAAR